MNAFKISCVLGLLLLTSSCAQVTRFDTISNNRQRIVLQGYSFIPTNEFGWKVLGRSSFQIALGKQGEEEGESYSLLGSLLKLQPFDDDEDFLDLVWQGQLADADPERYKIKLHVVERYSVDGAACARSHQVAVDLEAVSRSDPKDEMLRETASLICAHPQDRLKGVHLSYSQRYYTTQQPKGFMEKADSLIESLRFEPL